MEMFGCGCWMGMEVGEVKGYGRKGKGREEVDSVDSLV
jgi:hypothetical protein